MSHPLAIAVSATPETVAEMPVEAMETVDRLRAGASFVALRVSDAGRRADALEAIVSRMAQAETKIVWIGNPLRSPLTIERVFLQAVGAEADLRVERSPVKLASMLARSAGAARRLLLILQQPETLDAEARETIGALAPHLPDADPLVQFLFSGNAAFAPPSPPSPPPKFDPAAVTAAGTKVPAIPIARRREVVPLLLLLFVLVIGAGLPLVMDEGPAVIAPVPVASAPIAPAPAARMASAPVPSVSVPLASVPPVIDVGALRREFNAFLDQRAPTTVPLSGNQKDALFEEFLERRRQHPSSAAM